MNEKKYVWIDGFIREIICKSIQYIGWVKPYSLKYLCIISTKKVDVFDLMPLNISFFYYYFTSKNYS